MYTIVNKIEYDIVSGVVYTPLYYISEDNTSGLVESINTDYDNSLGVWIEDNITDLESGVKDIEEFFITEPIVYVARTNSTTTQSLTELENKEDI
tara:strand:- start:650 stop:934 length:285 start_codon:yes stop_codon:yes gene_type:complete